MFVKAKTVFRTSDGLATPGCVVKVDEKLGKRLVQSGAAVEAARPATLGAAAAPLPSFPGENPSKGVNAPEGPSEGETEDIDLNTLSYNQLKAMAQETGIETGKIRSKSGMIDAITAAQMNPGDDLPDLTPMDMVD